VIVVVVTPSMVKETSLTTVLADDEPPPPDALLAEEDAEEEIDDVASVCDVEEVAEVDWVPVGERSELAELIDMGGLMKEMGRDGLPPIASPSTQPAVRAGAAMCFRSCHVGVFAQGGLAMLSDDPFP
jgi:hypothetical protein